MVQCWDETEKHVFKVDFVGRRVTDRLGDLGVMNG